MRLRPADQTQQILSKCTGIGGRCRCHRRARPVGSRTGGRVGRSDGYGMAASSSRRPILYTMFDVESVLRFLFIINLTFHLNLSQTLLSANQRATTSSASECCCAGVAWWVETSETLAPTMLGPKYASGKDASCWITGASLLIFSKSYCCMCGCCGKSQDSSRPFRDATKTFHYGHLKPSGSAGR